MIKKKKKVYLGLSVDVLHHGHINIIKKANLYGDLTIGLLTDEAIAEKKRLPMLTWQQRFEILKNINGVSRIIAQKEWDYSSTLLKEKPDYLIHGDDWKNINSID